MAKCDSTVCCRPARSNFKTNFRGQFLPGPMLIKRTPAVGLELCKIGKTPLKNKRIYTDLSQTMAFDHLKPPGYALVELPYDLYCPSVQEKLKGPTGTKYQCQLPECKKIFTTLDLAKRHAMLTQHGKLAMEIVDHDNETHAADQPIDEDLEVLRL